MKAHTKKKDNKCKQKFFNKYVNPLMYQNVLKI